MTKKDWENLRVGQTIYYGPNRIPRIIIEVTANKSVVMNMLHKSKSACPEVIYPKYERYKFFLDK